MIKRAYSNLDKYLKKGKVLVIQGPRQVGKTTLVKKYLDSLKAELRSVYLTGDSIEAISVFSSQSVKTITQFSSNFDLIVIDEAQKIPNIGVGLKILVDSMPSIKVIVTGSASFDLVKQVGEPLVGRAIKLMLYPISVMEVQQEYDNDYMLDQDLEKFLVYGLYPEVQGLKSDSEKKEYLDNFVDMYLLKDVLEYSGIKGAKFVSDLLKLLAFQTGNLVSLNELSIKLGVNIKTVEKYLDLLEKTYIIFSIGGYSMNLRKEIRQKKKYYFYDVGIKNALVSNYNEVALRADIGALWENFLVVERLKKQEYTAIYSNNFFWRTWDQQEVDFVEEREGKLYGFEFKWQGNKSTGKKHFEKQYQEAQVKVINRSNYLGFITSSKPVV